MDGEKNGKPNENGWFGGNPTIFGNIHMVQSVVWACAFARLPLWHSSLEGREKYLLFEVTFYAKDICTKLQFPVTKKQVQQISFLILIYFYQIFLDDKANSPHNPHLVKWFFPNQIWNICKLVKFGPSHPRDPGWTWKNIFELRNHHPNMLKVTFHPKCMVFWRNSHLFNHHLGPRKPKFCCQIHHWFSTLKTLDIDRSFGHPPIPGYSRRLHFYLVCLVALDLLTNRPCTWPSPARWCCFNEKRRGNNTCGKHLGVGGCGCYKPWNWIIFPGVLVSIFVSNYFASYIHCFLPIMWFISCLHHVSKNPLICDLDFSFVLLQNPRHPSHPPLIPGLWRCEFGTLWKPVFWLGRGEWGFIPTDPHHVFGCLGLHYIFPYVLNKLQTTMMTRRAWHCIVIDPRIYPSNHTYIWAKRKRTNKNTYPPRN